MKQLLFIFPIFFVMQIYAQVGINTTSPNSTLTVNGSVQAKYNLITASAYTLSISNYYTAYTGTTNGTFTLPSVVSGSNSFAGRMYYIKNFSSFPLTIQASDGNFIRSMSVAGAANYVIPAGQLAVLVNNTNTSAAGVATWDVAFVEDTANLTGDATTIVGGTVYAKFYPNTGGTLTTRIITGNYSVGTNNPNVTPTVGGITSLLGTGYTVSNPAYGIFDIKFDTPFTQIYSASVIIVDAYGSSGGAVESSTTPIPDEVGQRLNTLDNTQVAYLDNNIIRIKTGDQYGNGSDRVFTFLVIGQ